MKSNSEKTPLNKNNKGNNGLSFLQDFSKYFAQLLQETNTELFIQDLVKLFKNVVAFDNVSIISYLGPNLPELEYNDTSTHTPSTIDLFIKGAFLLDPYYLAASRDNKHGFFHISQLTPEGFSSSEYYRTYYKNSGLKDECGYLIKIHQDKFINISLGRIDIAHNLKQAQLDSLKAITPLIETLVCKHWQHENKTQTPENNLRTMLELAFASFGEQYLTPREREIMQKVLHGYSSKAISRSLNIAVETVKLHRKNAYKKLDIKSQGELFHMFIDSVMSIENYKGGDPLIDYMHKASRSANS